MAPRSRLNGNDTDVSMADAPEPVPRHGDDMVCKAIPFRSDSSGTPRATTTGPVFASAMLTLA